MIVKIEGHWFHAWGNGNHTIDINIAPSFIWATACLHGHLGEGAGYAGIKHYRKRLSSGADQDIDFGGWPSWPPNVFDFMSSVTFAIAASEDAGAYLYARMDYWA